MRADGMPTLAEERRNSHVQACKDYFFDEVPKNDWNLILNDPTRVWNRNFIIAVMTSLNLSWTGAREIIIRSQCSLCRDCLARQEDKDKGAKQ